MHVLFLSRSVIQFAYGEDGIDVTSAAYLEELGFLAKNAEGVARRLDMAAALNASHVAHVDDLEARARAALE